MPSEKEIVCARCACRKLVPLNWQFSTCKDCLQKKKLYRKSHKSEIKTKREKRATLKSVRFSYMTIEQYRRYFPKASIETYKKEKKQFEAQQRFISEKDGEIWRIPCTSDLCYEFRETLLYGKARSPQVSLHADSCKNCMRFYVLWKNAYKIEGVNLWHGEEG